MVFYLNTDGACRGNPGISGVGAVVFDSNGLEVCKTAKRIRNGTNNQSEYIACIYGLMMCVNNKIPLKDVVFQADSNLVVQQISGKWKVKDNELKKLYSVIQCIFKTFGKPREFKHIYRENNTRADQLANIGANMPYSEGETEEMLNAFFKEKIF